MSSPYWDGLYSRETEPPADLTGVDRESWLRGKQEAMATKAMFQRPSKAAPAAPQASRPPLAEQMTRVGSGINWRRTGMLAAVVLLVLGVGAAAYYGDPSTVGWVLFAVAVVALVWRLAGPDVTRRQPGG